MLYQAWLTLTMSSYVEASTFLYAQNTFGFDEISSLLQFTSIVVPQHWHAISKLSLKLNIHLDALLDAELERRVPDSIIVISSYGRCQIGLWNNIWRRIAEMKNLRYLDVCVFNVGIWLLPGRLCPASHEDELAILAPLYEIEKTQLFRVGVPWKIAPGEEPLNDTPFDQLEHDVCQKGSFGC